LINKSKNVCSLLYVFFFLNTHDLNTNLNHCWLKQNTVTNTFHVSILTSFNMIFGPSWSWSYGSWIYNLMLWVRIPLRRGVLDTTLCDKIWKWLVTGRWFSPVSTTNKTDRHDITEILLKVTLNAITPPPLFSKINIAHLHFNEV
jgi:hypothetical protein